MKENEILDKVASISPWLAPLIPTYFATYNAIEYLAKGNDPWDWAMVIVIALVVETIGLAAVHTLMQFWNWNRRRAAGEAEAPILPIAASVIIYIVIVITVNAMLDYFKLANPASLPYVRILAIAMLSLLSLNSALIVALRAGQSDRVQQAEKAKAEALAVTEAQKADAVLQEQKREQKEAQEKAEAHAEKLRLEAIAETLRLEKKADRDLRKVSENFPAQVSKLPKDTGPVEKEPDWRKVSLDDKEWMVGKTQEQIAKTFKLSDRTANNWFHRTNPNAKTASKAPKFAPSPGD